MSDQDTPPPMDDNSPEKDTQPPIEAASDAVEETVEKVADGAEAAVDAAGDAVKSGTEAAGEAIGAAAGAASEAAESVASSLPMEAPSAEGIGLAQGKMAESDERTMSLLAHILGGVTCVLGPLIIWLIKKDESPFVDDQGKEATNFQITVLIGYGVAMILSFIPLIQCVAALLFPAISVASLIFAILGGIEANKGVAYRYPFAVRFIS